MTRALPAVDRAPAAAPAPASVPAAPTPAPAPASATPATQPCGDRVAVKVWQVPVRLIHWLLVAAIVVLTLTGLYIGTPVPVFGRSGHVMAYARAIHIGTGLAFIGLLLARVVFAFTGNQYARWHQFLPVYRRERQQIVPALRFYLFLTREPPDVVGHNPLAGMTYTVLFAMLGLEALTGMALDALPGRSGWLWFLSGWIFQLASVGTVRLVHHLILWLVWGFAIHHVYSAMLMDNVERSGIISSMISGWKNIRKDAS